MEIYIKQFTDRQEVMLDIFMLGIHKTENFPKNTNAPSALPISNASALRASKGVHNKLLITLCK